MINILINNRRQEPIFSNVAEGTHAGNMTCELSEAISQRYLLGAHDGTGKIQITDGDVRPFAVITDSGEAGDRVNAALLCCAGSTLLMVAGEAIAAGAEVYAAAGGQLQGQPTVAGVFYHVGFALGAASGAGQIIEVEPIAPRKTVVISALTGTAAIDIASLGGAYAQAPDKMIVLSD